MQINIDTKPEAYSIHSYGDHFIIVNSPTTRLTNSHHPTSQPASPNNTTIKLTSSAIITPEKLISDWRPQSMAQLTKNDLEILSDLQPELVILGTGKQIIFPDPSCTLPLIRQGIGVEVMNTPAACRTYNFLMTDDRRVLVALFIE